MTGGMSERRWIGPARGPVVVALHDDGGSPADWEAMAQGLGRIGYRVLALARGPAEGVAEVEAALRAEGLLDEARGLGAVDPGLTLLGHGQGGAVATAFAAERPERVRRLILLAAAGIAALREPAPPPPRPSPLAPLARLPLLGRLFAPPPAPPPPEDALPQEAEHRRIGREDVPVIAIWGEADAEVPLRALGRLAAWNRAARQEVIAGANHDLPRTQAEHVVAILRAEFREEA